MSLGQSMGGKRGRFQAQSGHHQAEISGCRAPNLWHFIPPPAGHAVVSSEWRSHTVSTWPMQPGRAYQSHPRWCCAGTLACASLVCSSMLLLFSVGTMKFIWCRKVYFLLPHDHLNSMFRRFANFFLPLGNVFCAWFFDISVPIWRLEVFDPWTRTYVQKSNLGHLAFS